MTIFNTWLKIIGLFISLLYLSPVFAERDIADHIELPQAQLQQLELNNFKVLGLVQLKQNAGSDFPLMEFSALAWDNDEQQLILLSDRGFIVHTKPEFENDRFIDLDFIAYHYLKDIKGKKLRHKSADSEGLALMNSNNGIQGDTELIISFERKPRIIQFSSTGKFIAKHSLNNPLSDINNYAGANKALEAITLHNTFNIITGPERPLNASKNNQLSLHTLNKKSWQFTPDNETYGSLVGLTTLPDNRLIALERIFSSIFAGVSNAIHLITLGQDSIKTEKIASLAPSASYLNDNFEGITWHKDNHFFIVSDDNDNLFQKSLLVYFEIPNLNDKE
jgi:hypothetical protein